MPTLSQRNCPAAVSSIDFEIVIERIKAGERNDKKLVYDINEPRSLVVLAGGLSSRFNIKMITSAVRLNSEEGESPNVDKA